MRKIELLGLATVTIFYTALFLGGCGILSPLKHPKKDLVDCYAHALEPVAGEVFDTAQLAKDLVQGKADLRALLGNLNASEAEAKALIEGLNQCAAPPPPASLPSGSPS